jgi:hypothetical protein
VGAAVAGGGGVVGAVPGGVAGAAVGGGVFGVFGAAGPFGVVLLGVVCIGTVAALPALAPEVGTWLVSTAGCVLSPSFEPESELHAASAVRAVRVPSAAASGSAEIVFRFAAITVRPIKIAQPF